MLNIQILNSLYHVVHTIGDERASLYQGLLISADWDLI